MITHLIHFSMNESWYESHLLLLTLWHPTSTDCVYHLCRMSCVLLNIRSISSSCRTHFLSQVNSNVCYEKPGSRLQVQDFLMWLLLSLCFLCLWREQQVWNVSGMQPAARWGRLHSVRGGPLNVLVDWLPCCFQCYIMKRILPERDVHLSKASLLPNTLQTFYHSDFSRCQRLRWGASLESARGVWWFWRLWWIIKFSTDLSAEIILPQVSCVQR